MRVDQPGQAGVLLEFEPRHTGWHFRIAGNDGGDSTVFDNHEPVGHRLVRETVDERAAAHRDSTAVRVIRYLRDRCFRLAGGKARQAGYQ